MTRAAIRELPDGVYDFLDYIDDDGVELGKPIPIKVTITKSGDQIKVRLDRLFAAGERRDQQHPFVHEIGELLRDPLDPAATTFPTTKACSAPSRSPRHRARSPTSSCRPPAPRAVSPASA